MADPLVLYSTLDDATSLSQPVVGSAATISGTPTFQAVKFNNGIYGANTGNNAYFTYTTPSAFCIEFWCKALAASTTDGHIWAPGATNYFEMQMFSNNFYVSVYQSGFTSRYLFPLTFSSSEVFHLLVVFDTGAGNKIRLFKNASEISVGSKALDSAWGSVATRMQLFGVTAYGVSDNLKTWSNASATTIADINKNINNKRHGLKDQLM